MRYISFFFDKILRPLNKQLYEKITLPISFQRNITYFIPNSIDPKKEILDYNLIEITECFFANTSNHKVWDLYLGLQVTPDLLEIHGRKLKVVPLEELDEFLDYWYFKKYHSKSTSKCNANSSWSTSDCVYVNEAYSLPLSKILALGNSIHPNSFISPRLTKIINTIYQSDFKLYSTTNNRWNKDE